MDGAVPVTVLRSHPGALDTPCSPDELTAWVNHLLGLKPHKGVGRRHPGIQRLSRWVVNRLTCRPNSAVRSSELLGKARQWLPEYFEDYVVDPKRLHAYRRVKTIQVETEITKAAREEEARALGYLEHPKVSKRVRGLALLADLEAPDLYEWCVMCLEDESVEVRVAALRTMLRCTNVDPEPVIPLLESENKRIRAAAVAVLARHCGKEHPGWFRLGLTDPAPCVRLAAVRFLGILNRSEQAAVFEIARHDPNREVARRVRNLVSHKGRPRRRTAL